MNPMVHLGLSNSRMKDFTDLAIAALRTVFEGGTLVAAIRATFRRRGHSYRRARSSRSVNSSSRMSEHRPTRGRMLSARACGNLNIWRNSSKNCERSFPGRWNMLGPARRSQRDGRRAARGSDRLVWTHQAVAPVVADPNGSTLACQGRVSGERGERSLDTPTCFRKIEAGATGVTAAE